MIITVRITIDRGGTFCDVWARTSDGRETLFKILSVDPSNYKNALTKSVRRVLEFTTGSSLEQGALLNGSIIEWVKVGTTVATKSVPYSISCLLLNCRDANALLERKGKRFASLTTAGFRDVCVIGTQRRPKLFDLNIKNPDVLYDKVVEISERVTIKDYALNPFYSRCDFTDAAVVQIDSGEVVRIITKLDEDEARLKLRALYSTVYSMSKGNFEEEAIRQVFLDVADNPGCSATRRLNDNISDLKAQIAANQRGIKLLTELCMIYTLQHVQFYMDAIQKTAECAIREFLKRAYTQFDDKPLAAIDYFDDGTAVVVQINILSETGSAIFDFEGTGEETYGNMNFPISITSSAIAGPHWHGTSAVHVHSTNTKIAYPEVIEKRTPVIVERHQVREGTGGGGEFRGGNGITRKIRSTSTDTPQI